MNAPPLLTKILEHPQVVFGVLGGSRAGMLEGKNSSADYDVFLGIESTSLTFWKDNFAEMLRSLDSSIIFAAFDVTKDGWGHLYGVLLESGNYLDLSLVDAAHPEQFCLNSNNKILIDKSGSLLHGVIQPFEQTAHDPKKFYERTSEHLFGRFCIDWLRLGKALKSSDYNLAVRYLMFLRNQTIMLWRKLNGEFGTVPSIPEKGPICGEFSSELQFAVILDGTLKSVCLSQIRLKALVSRMKVDTTVLDTIDLTLVKVKNE